MPLKATTDAEFIALVIHQCERMFSPGFGDQKFFNRELFNYVLELATTDVERLRNEIHAFAREFKHPEWDIQIRADNSQPAPAIHLKIVTPTRTETIAIHADGIEVHAPE